MAAPAKKHPTFSLIDELLAEQATLQTPAARASQSFDQIPNQESGIPNFRSLIPLTSPRPGEQYAFEVDLDACSGCKACVSACHSLNGLDETETWRDVGLVVGEDAAHPFTQTITTACHHCADPACLNGCPVLAYEKDPLTGIVRHLDDQCIGCSYCVLTCPYDVPKYNPARGIVRKCDMCHGRLAVGEAPACAQACPTHAIKIITVATAAALATPPPTAAPAKSEISNHESRIIPIPAYTQPTTRYVSKRPLPARLVPADAAVVRPQPPHWPLVVMLTLMPMSVGAALAAALLAPASPALALTAWLAAAAGLGASVFHLGQPLRAWRIFLGLRRSWLSREAVVFGAYFGAASAYALVAFGWWATLPFVPPLAPAAAALATAALGLVGLFCSAMIYADTRRTLWRFAQTGPRFLGTAAVLGFAPVAPAAAALALALKLVVEARVLFGATDAASARVLRGPLRVAHALRLAFALAGLALLAVSPWLALIPLFAGELAERYLYFRAVVAFKMPGQPAP